MPEAILTRLYEESRIGAKGDRMTAWQRDPLADLDDESQRRDADRVSILRIRARTIATPTAASQPPVETVATLSGLHRAVAAITTTALLVEGLRARWEALDARFEALLRNIDRSPEIEPVHRDALLARTQDLEELHDALRAAERAAAHAGVASLLARGASLPPFLMGLHLLCEHAMSALERAAVADDAWALHAELEHASHFYFDGLIDPIRGELASLSTESADERESLARLDEAAEDLFCAARWLDQRLA